MRPALEERGLDVPERRRRAGECDHRGVVAVGYMSEELKTEIFELDFKAFVDKGWEDRVQAADDQHP